MATTTNQSQVFEVGTERAEEKLYLDGGLVELPRRHCMKTADLGIAESDYQSIASSYAAGDDTHKEKCEIALQVFLEMMSRTPAPAPRPIQDALGAPERGPKGGFLAKRCSEFAVGIEDCHPANTGRSNPRPTPGAWKTFVETHWRQIMPRLVFTSEIANPGLAASALDYDPVAWKETWKKNTSNESQARRDLLSWLVPFLKNPVCKWDGTK